jgi:hypothetical protein
VRPAAQAVLWRAIAAGVLCAVLALTAASAGAASARTASGCGSFPRPGTTSTGPAPADLRAEYSVLGRPRRAIDKVAVRRLGALPLSGLLPAGVRYLGAAAYGGRVYVVPGRHLLAAPLEPVRCEPKSRRALQRALLPSLRSEYAQQGLCLVVVYRTQASPTCQPAPGTVAPFLFGPGSPGFGLAPDGVGGVVLHFRVGPARRASVRRNFWIVNDPTLLATPCGLDWTTASGIVLRTVATCTKDTT